MYTEDSVTCAISFSATPEIHFVSFRHTRYSILPRHIWNPPLSAKSKTCSIHNMICYSLCLPQLSLIFSSVSRRRNLVYEKIRHSGPLCPQFAPRHTCNSLSVFMDIDGQDIVRKSVRPNCSSLCLAPPYLALFLFALYVPAIHSVGHTCSLFCLLLWKMIPVDGLVICDWAMQCKADSTTEYTG